MSWLRTTRFRRCPVCGSTKWCSVNAATRVVKCMKQPEGAFHAKEDGSGMAYYHAMSGRDQVLPQTRSDDRPSKAIMPDWSRVLRLAQITGPKRIRLLGESLGLSPGRLLRSGIGWLDPSVVIPDLWEPRKHSTGAWTMPMFDADGNVIGIRLRYLDGSYYSIKGSRNGLFIPDRRLTGNLLVVEGMTDALAAHDARMVVVGRPSSTGGTDFLLQLIRGLEPPLVGFCIDNDPTGSLAQRATLDGVIRAVKALPKAVKIQVSFPPVGKDFRDAWVQDPQAVLNRFRSFLRQSTSSST